MTKRRRIAVGCAMLVGLFVVLIGAVLIPIRDFARRAQTLANMKHMGLVCGMYAGDHTEHQYPPPTPRVPLAAPDLLAIYPEYLTWLSILHAATWHKGYAPFEGLEQQWPAHLAEAERIVAINHVYFGYAFSTESELNILLDAIPTLSAHYPQPIARPDGPPILPLGEAARLAAQTPPAIDANRTILMFENPRLNGGKEDKINVLYLDGRAATLSRADFFPKAHFDRLPADPVASFW